MIDAQPDPATGRVERLRRHIPELAIEWALDSPERLWQRVEGTLCFADVSGFTALAERLAQQGRVGGEELVETLGSLFGKMLDIVRGRGGQLLKFGGDALLLFFRGADHALHAASAAVEMRQVLRDAVNTRTSVGPLRLSMSTGLHTGDVLLFLVGSTHRELILLGPAANQVVAVENAAEAGEILLSAATAAALPTDAVKLRADGERLLRWRKAPIAPVGLSAAPPANRDALLSLLPKVLGAYLEEGTPDPEHRVACIAFVRFSGTDALLAEAGEDVLAAALQQTIGSAQECLEREGVTLLTVDIDKDGGKLFLGSGVPFSHDDDEGVMLRALKGIQALQVPLALQMGVSRGHVFVAEVGASTRAAYSAMGDTTNTAARITAKAPIGEIYAHPSVLDECLTRYAVTPSPPLVMKGKRAPLVAYQIGEELGTRQREGLEVSTFFGRVQELEVLCRLLRETREGHGHVLMVSGDSGLGKSRLLREALSQAAADPLLTIRGEPYGSNSPYRAFVRPLRQLLGIESGSQDEMRTALSAVLAEVGLTDDPFISLLGPVVQIQLEESPEVVALDPRFVAERTGRLVEGLLAKACPGPRILLVEDAHWLDRASADLMAQLSAACVRHGWLVLAARRSIAGGFVPQGATSLDLGPLDDESIRALVLMVTEAAPLRPHELELVVARAGGNPLFATEIIKAAREVGSFDALPVSLEAAMATQVDALDPASRRLLRCAAVLGRSFPEAALAVLAKHEGLSIGEALLERLGGFLEPDGPGRLRFRSGIIHATTYESLSFRRRAQLHRLAGEHLEAVSDGPAMVAADLALHFARAGDHARTWRYARMAAERARKAGASGDAVRLLDLAIGAARRIDLDGSSLAEALLELGDAQVMAGMAAAAVAAYNGAARAARDDARTVARVFLQRSSAKQFVGQMAGALRDLAAGQRLLRSDDSSDGRVLHAQLESAAAMTYLGKGRPAKAKRIARDAVDSARRVNNLNALAEALMVIDLADLLMVGPGDGANLRQSLAIFERLGKVRMQASVLENLGCLHAFAGRLAEGLECFQSAMSRYAACGDEVSRAAAGLNVGELLVNQRRYAQAREVLIDALRVMRSTGSEEGLMQGETQIARILIQEGHYADAERMLMHACDLAETIGMPLKALEVALVIADCCTRSGRAEAALERLETAAARAGHDLDLLAPLIAYHRARALKALNRPAESLDVLSSGLELARAHGQSLEEALLLEERALVLAPGSRAEAEADEAAAMRIFASLGIDASVTA